MINIVLVVVLRFLPMNLTSETQDKTLNHTAIGDTRGSITSGNRTHILRETVIVSVLCLALVFVFNIKIVNAQSEQVTLKPSDDTFVDSENGTSNYGQQPYLQIRLVPEYPLPAALWSRRSLVWLKFNLPSVPDGAVVDVATLQLHTSSVNETFLVAVFPCSDNSWNESTLTYFNQPWDPNPPIDYARVTTNDHWYDWSVTNAVRDALNTTDKTLSLVLANRQSDQYTSLWFDSKEATINSTDYSPRLTFQWTTKISHPILGDVDGDFKVNLKDLVLLAKAYGSRPYDSNWNANADFDGDGVVGLSDLAMLAQNYGRTA
jgi:hypothetical protein